MQLFANAFSCSLATRLVAAEAGIPLQVTWVNLSAKQTEDGADYWAVNPKGAVPALRLDDGQVLTEGVAIMQYLGSALEPADRLEKARLQEWLNYLSSEVHKKVFYFMFRPDVPAEGKAFSRGLADREFRHIDQHLAGRDYLVGNSFTAADAYLLTVLNWARFAGIDLSPYVNVTAYQGRLATRPAIARTLADEAQAFERLKAFAPTGV